MKMWLAATAATIALSGPALAQQAPAKPDAPVTRVLYICEDDAFTRADFAKEFGKAKFITAEQALTTVNGWDKPRCITPDEHAKLMRMKAAAKAAEVTKIKG
jgi:hypothetical protein